MWYVENVAFNATRHATSISSLENCPALNIKYEFPHNENSCLFHSFLPSVIITTVLYLSDALRKNFLNENFDYKVKDRCNSCYIILWLGGYFT